MEETVYKIYQKFGDLLTGKRRQASVLFLFIFIVFTACSYPFRISVSPDILYWTLSSIIQSLLALTALMIVSSIFKLQILHSREEKIVDEVRLNFDFVDHTGRLNEILPLRKIVEEEIDKIHAKKGSEIRRLKEIKQIGENILLSQELTKDFTLKFAIYNSFVVGLSLIFLIFAPLISNYYFGIPALYLIGLLFIYSLFLVIKGITDSLWQ